MNQPHTSLPPSSQLLRDSLAPRSLPGERGANESRSKTDGRSRQLRRNQLRAYLVSFRLRTLPLSLSGIFLGSLLARADGHFRWDAFGWAVATTLCLQILSNLANEWGDLQKGTDNADRLGPIRSIQSGGLSLREFKRMIAVFAGLSAVCGCALVYTAFEHLFTRDGLVMLGLGAAAMVAAVKYTVGKKAYGYRGMGDLSVFLFFGLLSVCGSYFLLAESLSAWVFLPASAIGMLSAGVLNLNNMRDIDNDRKCGKRTLPVMMGIPRAKIYHYALIAGAFLCMGGYVAARGGGIRGWLFLVTLPLFAGHIAKVARNEGRELDAQLKVLSLATLLFALLGGCQTGFSPV